MSDVGLVLHSWYYSLLMLDILERDQAPEYAEHRKNFNALLRPCNFVVGVSHLGRHCLVPLVPEDKSGTPAP